MIHRRNILFLVVATLLSNVVFAQQDSLSLTVVKQYLTTLNYDNLPNNKIVYMESKIINTQIADDTAYMKRWFLGNAYSRIELYHQGKLIVGYNSNGKEHWRYNALGGNWYKIGIGEYYDSVVGYNYQKPLHTWEARSLEFIECVSMRWENQDVYRVTVKDPDHLDRHYLFEKSSGLLFFMQPVEPETGKKKHEVAWRAINEYMPVEDFYLFPSIESYQWEDNITIYFTTTQFLPFDESIFRIK